MKNRKIIIIILALSITSMTGVGVVMGLVYDKLGEAEKAKQEFIKVAEINPDNDEVRKILQNLREGKPALAGIIPSEPPIEETPPEIPGETSEEISEDVPGGG